MALPDGQYRPPSLAEPLYALRREWPVRGLDAGADAYAIRAVGAIANNGRPDAGADDVGEPDAAFGAGPGAGAAAEAQSPGGDILNVPEAHSQGGLACPREVIEAKDLVELPLYSGMEAYEIAGVEGILLKPSGCPPYPPDPCFLRGSPVLRCRERQEPFQVFIRPYARMLGPRVVHVLLVEERGGPANDVAPGGRAQAPGREALRKIQRHP